MQAAEQLQPAIGAYLLFTPGCRPHLPYITSLTFRKCSVAMSILLSCLFNPRSRASPKRRDFCSTDPNGAGRSTRITYPDPFSLDVKDFQPRNPRCPYLPGIVVAYHALLALNDSDKSLGLFRSPRTYLFQ